MSTEQSQLDKKDGATEYIEASTHIVTDAAAKYIDPNLQVSPEQSGALRKRIHMRILPFLCLGYLCQGLDKGTLTASSIMGWLTDTNAQGQDFSLTTTMLWCGIILAEPVANQFVRRLPIGQLLGSGVLIWSALVFGLGFSLQIPAVLAVRFLLGCFEAIVGPCLVALMVQWYTVEEQPFVLSVWQCMLGVSNIITSLLAYGFYHVQSGTIKSWQWLHIAIGIISALASALIFIYLPDTPASARWATEEEKRMLVERVRSNNQGIQNKVFKRAQMLEAFEDPYTWCMFILPFFNTLVVGGVSTFGGLLITKAFGFDTLTAQLLNLPIGVVQIICFLSIGYLVRRTRQTFLVMIAFTIPNIVGTVVLLTVTPGGSASGGLVVAYYMMQLFGACYPAILMLLSRNVAGQTKRSITYAVTFIGWAGGNSISPQIFQSVWAPRYFNSLYIHLGLYACFILTCLATRTLLLRRNAKKDALLESRRAQLAGGETGETANQFAFEDLTDRENPDFKYCI